jgi:hypothetical protein
MLSVFIGVISVILIPRHSQDYLHFGETSHWSKNMKTHFFFMSDGSLGHGFSAPHTLGTGFA